MRVKKLSLLSRNFYKNKKEILNELIDAIKKLLSTRDDIKKIIILGSILDDRFGIGSDADILIILKESQYKRFFDRIPEFLDFFNKNVSIPVDLFIYTEDEIDKMKKNNNFFIKRALLSNFCFEQ